MKDDKLSIVFLILAFLLFMGFMLAFLLAFIDVISMIGQL